MIDWLHALAAASRPVVLVTVASVEGSAPRAPGAKMVVDADQLFDTIGGGHLEMRVLEIARLMLSGHESATPMRFDRFSLGPSLGQCCGGVVHLLFERIDPAVNQPMISNLTKRWAQQRNTLRIVAIDAGMPPALFDEDGNNIDGSGLPWPAGCKPDLPCHVVKDFAGQRWLIDPCVDYRPHLLLFGAGHVGTAVVKALADLPCRVTWVDERDTMFPATVPDNVRVELTDTPQVLVDRAPPGTSFLVMTHSHALDQVLAEHILRRDAGEWFGLIGSLTKRAQFERRLRERGISVERLQKMVCPIGIANITGKAPAVIAISVVAQLLRVWEAQAAQDLQALQTAQTSAVHADDPNRRQYTAMQKLLNVGHESGAGTIE